MRASVAIYPQSYYRILISLAEDGTPTRITLRTKDEAEALRFQFYNFLKWARRPINVHSVAHLQGRYNMVQVKLDGPSLLFSLRTSQRFVAIDDAISAQLSAQGIPEVEVPHSFAKPPPRLPPGEALPREPDFGPPPAPEFALPSFAENAKSASAIALTALQPPVEDAHPSLLRDDVPVEGQPPNAMDTLQAMIPEREQEMYNRRLLETYENAKEEARTAIIPKRQGWYGGDTKVELDIADRNEPRAQFGRALDAAIFEMRPYTINYAVKEGEHEPDERLSKQHFQAYSDLLIETRLGGWIELSRSPQGFLIQAIPEAFNMLAAFGWVAPRLENTVDWKDRNKARPQLLNLFQENQA